MQKLTHGANLLQLTRLPRVFPVNCYLVRDNDGLILVDAALPGSQQGIVQAARSLGAPITRIILTHAHMDHVGALDALHALLPDAEVMISARDSRMLAGDKTTDPGEPKLRGSYKTCSTKPTRLLVPGDRVGALEVIASPGHTPGHLAFFDTRDRSLIAGDAFQTRGKVAVTGTLVPLFPFPAFATWSKDAALESARRLRALNPSRLAVGHGAVLQDPAGAMDRAIAEAARAAAVKA